VNGGHGLALGIEGELCHARIALFELFPVETGLLCQDGQGGLGGVPFPLPLGTPAGIVAESRGNEQEFRGADPFLFL